MSDPILPPPDHPEPHPAGTPAEIPLLPGGVDDASSQALAEAFHSSFRIVKLLMAVLVLVFLCSGMFVVQPNQQALVLLFGRPLGVGAEQLRGPGWHWAWPYPINEVVRIRTGEIQTASSTSGWHATTPEMEALNQEPPAMGLLRPEGDGYLLTADGNIIHARATVKFRITDPVQYTFAFASAPSILTNLLNNALIHTAARMTADAALYRDKTGFRDRVLERVKARVAELELGITLEPSDVESKAPVDVRAAFEAVNAAEQERSRKISDALGYRDQITSKALGEADAILARSIGSSNRLVTSVDAEARAFSDQLPEYLRDPALFRDRLLAARLSRVMTNTQEKFFLPARAPGQSREIRLELSREPVKREGPATR